MFRSASIALDDGLDVSEVVTKGSLLQINQEYHEINQDESDTKCRTKTCDFLGRPVSNFRDLDKDMIAVDENGYVKKKILEEGGGCDLNESFTVSIAYTCYWENEDEAFDMKSLAKPLQIDLNDHRLLPGLETAIKSMLVGELSIFLLSYKVMYGELGLPPRIKPKQDCVCYIKLISSVHTPKNGVINFNEPNMFDRVRQEVLMLLGSGIAMHKAMNISVAASLFNKAVLMLHKCCLADENEEKIQIKLLIKLYMNLAICYNKLNLPLKACTACNELIRLDSLWNNHKALFQNAKALRMIGVFKEAERRLNRAMKLAPKKHEFEIELELLQKLKETYDKNKLLSTKLTTKQSLSTQFTNEVDQLLLNFKENVNLCRLNLPPNLNNDELNYVKEACIREKLYVIDGQNSSLIMDDTSDVPEKQVFLDKNEHANYDISEDEFVAAEVDTY